MTYQMPPRTYGGNVILAPAMFALCQYVHDHRVYGQKLTNLGTLGDQRHSTQGYSSDHNPFIVHDGKRYIRAADFGGPYGVLMDLRAELFDIYEDHDPRIWPFGYLKGPDSNINNWTPNGGPSGWHIDRGDEGHLHVSLNQKNGYAPSPRGFVVALNSTAPWGKERNALVALNQEDKDTMRRIAQQGAADAITAFFGPNFMQSDVDDNGKPDKGLHPLSEIVRDEVRDQLRDAGQLPTPAKKK